jgi:hypothetical protein
MIHKYLHHHHIAGQTGATVTTGSYDAAVVAVSIDVM